MAKAGLSRAEIDEAVLSEGGPRRSRGRNGSAGSEGFASRAEDYAGPSELLEDRHGMSAVYEEQSVEDYDEHDETVEQWQHSDGEQELRRTRLPMSRREMMSADGHDIDRGPSPPPNGYESGPRLPRGGGERGYRDDYGEDDGDDESILHRNSSQDYLESEVADDVAYRGGRHRGESSESAGGTTMERATLPGAYASMEDPNAKSQIKEQIQNELQEFERALRSTGGNGRAPNRRGHGPRSDDSYPSEESIRQASASRRGMPPSRRGGDHRSGHYYGRGGDDDSYYDESSVNSSSSLHRQTSRGTSSTSSDRRTYMERGGSGRNIISRNIPRERDLHDRGGMSQRRDSGERFYHDGDPRDRGARYERSYEYQDYYERGGGGGAGDDDSLVSDRGGRHSSSSLSRRELESRLALSRGHDRGGSVSGGGYRGGGAPGGRSHVDRGTGGDHYRTYDDGSHGSYRNSGDRYHRHDRSPQQSYSQPYSRRQNTAPDHRNNHRGADYHRSYAPADRHPPHQHQQFQQQPSHQQPQQRQVELEISPGVWMSLRGADETWNAIMNGSYCPTTCMMCNLNLLCVLDAEYVLCPECRVVGPIGDDEFGMRAEMLGSDSKPHGVGLGFKPDDLMRWQSEIARGIDPRNSSFFSQSDTI